MIRKMRIWKIPGQPRWVWDCTLCQPPTMGHTARWDRCLANARRHCERNRRYHHLYVARNYGRNLPDDRASAPAV